LPAWLRPRGGPGLSVAAAATVRPFRRALPIPRVLTGANLTIPIKPADLAILPGSKTRMWTYGGTFPGPTIRRPSGARTTVTFKHRLPRKAGELSVHVHGGHNTSADDGQPGGLTSLQSRSLFCDISPGLSERAAGNNLLIRPGRRRKYTFNLVEDGEPERAAMHWYHDHRLERTGENVWRGLAGMWIVDDEVDAALPLPRGKRDIPLMIADRSFNRRNQLMDPFGRGLVPPNDQVTGRHVLINGVILPHHRVEAQRYRLRVLNASNFRAYNLRLTGGVPMVQIGTEAGLMPAPVARDRVLIGPGERVELIVDFAAARGKRVELQSVAREDGPSALGSRTYVGALMQFRVGSDEFAEPVPVPATLRELPDWVGSAPSEASFEWRVTVGTGIRPKWLINGETFNPSRVLTTVPIGSVATWEIVNDSGVAHMMHPHHTDWVTLARRPKDGSWQDVPEAERYLKETFFLDPGESIRIAGKMSDYTGKYVIHCHMLDHEDHGLMSQFAVVPAP